MSPRRISFILPQSDLSGGVRVVAIYARKLQQRGHQVTVLTRPDPASRWQWRAKSLVRGRGWPELPASHLDELGTIVKVCPFGRPIDASMVPDCDAVIATWWQTAEWVAGYPPAKGRQFHFIQHYEAFPGQPVGRVDAVWRLGLKKITISQWLVDLAARFGDTQVALVLNSVDMSQFCAPPRGRQPRPTIGMLYSDVPFKGCDVSLEALRHVKAVFDQMQLVSFGLHPPRAHLALPEGTLYDVRPSQRRIAQLYGMCDLWLCGSRAEGFHLPILEAMACRCPVVATRVGGAVDVIRQGVNGHLVDVEDAAALGQRALDVLQLPDAAWRAMSDAAYATAAAYSWDDAADAFERALFENS